jgi:hypothetical protein
MKNIYKYIYLTIILSLVYSCSNIKEIRERKKNPITIESPDTLLVNNYYNDSLLLILEELESTSAYPEASGLDPIIEVDKSIYLESEPMKENKTEMVKKENVNHLKSTTRNIIDNDTVSHPKKDNIGVIAYSVPGEMKVGDKYQIKVRISKEQNKTKLIVGDRNISINDENVNSNVTIESIRVEPTMSALLLSSEAFEINPLSTETQNIEDLGYTEWGWVVKPLKSGNNFLKLIVKVKVKTDDDVYYKDIVIFDKSIKIKTNIKHGLSEWLSSYWQWLMTTIIIPLVIFFYKKRKGKEKD